MKDTIIRFISNMKPIIVSVPSKKEILFNADVKYITKENLPSELKRNGILYTTDTNELFAGLGSGKGLQRLSDVVIHDKIDDFPEEGIVEKIYIDKTKREIYFWNERRYVAIASAGGSSTSPSVNIEDVFDIVGDFKELETSEKGDLVKAINETFRLASQSIPVASDSQDGLLSKEDYEKLQGIPKEIEVLSSSQTDATTAINELKTYVDNEVGKAGSKGVDESDIADLRILQYNAALDALTYVDPPTPGSMDSADIEYTTDVNSNIKSIKDALDFLLYTAPSISSFTVSPSFAEKGSVVTDVTLNWGYNKAIPNQSIDQGVGSLDPALRTYSLTGQNIIANRQYTLTASDGRATVTKSATISFQNKRYWGSTSKAVPISTDVPGFGNSEYSATRVQSKKLSAANEYYVFAWPSMFGTPTFRINGMLNTAWIKTTVPLTNSSGFTENYDIYRSEFLQNGSVTIDVT